jgi:hypothetical protein
MYEEEKYLLELEEYRGFDIGELEFRSCLFLFFSL